MSKPDVVHPFSSDLERKMKRGKVVTAQEAVAVIRDNDTVAMQGFVGIGFPELLARTLASTHEATNHPRGLTLVYSAGIGDGKGKGVNRLASPKLLRRVIGGHWGLAPDLQALAFDDQIEAYNLPQGVIAQMFRDIAAHKPRTITHVGLETFVDPRNGGGRINARTTEPMVELLDFDGEQYLGYRTFPIDVAILRGTTADLDGNVTMEREALTLDALSIATAARNSGGVVIVQVERIADRDTLDGRDVVIPGVMVDCVVQSTPEDHWQTYAESYNPAYTGEVRVPLSSLPKLDLDERKIMARRAAFELRPNAVVNLGIGVPETIAAVAAEEGIFDLLTLTAEPGVIGGIPAGGLSFGAATNVEALIDMPYQFDWYDGGGLDAAFLGLAQADAHGNLNVSKFGPRLAGCGGFINISQNAKKVVFTGTFTAGGLEVSLALGHLRIDTEGKIQKFVEQVEQVTFSGPLAGRTNQPVLYVTERCVFTLTPEGLALTEVAPGIDVERDILAHMKFEPLIPSTPATMDERIFLPEPMGLKDILTAIPLADRFTYDPTHNILFVNFEGLTITDEKTIDEVGKQVDAICTSVGKRVSTIVNYDNFTIGPNLVDLWTAMVERVVRSYYDSVTRYTTSAFLRMKLGDALRERDVAPHIYESREEARDALPS